MKIKEKTKDAFLNVLARLIQVVVAVLIISPFAAGIINARLFFIGFLLFCGLTLALIFVGQLTREV